MALVFAAFVPHPPLLIPSIGKENISRLKNTSQAFKKLEEELYASQPETIFIISPHGLVQAGSFTMNLSPQYTADFEQFGDFTTKVEFSGDVGLAHRIREHMETRAPLQLVSQPNLDYGSSIPLYLLTEHQKNVKIIPFYYSGLDLEAHFKMGQLIKRELIFSQNRIAVVASGDLSHRVTKNAPAGYSPKGKKFDKKVIEFLMKKKGQELINLKHEFIFEACECGLKSLLVLSGILEGINYQPQQLSYEAPFGVGYLAMNFKL